MNIIILDASETARLKVEELLNDIKVDSYNIHSYENSNEALEFIEDKGADLIMSSVELKGMDGVSFVDMILYKYPKMISKLFIMSGSPESSSFKEIKEIGAKRFIKKPINEEYFKHFIIPEINKIILNKLK